MTTKPELGRFEEMLGMSEASGDILRILGHATMSALGFYVGVTDKGFVSYVGWALGVGAAAGTVLDIIGLVDLLQKEESLSGVGQAPQYPTLGGGIGGSVGVLGWRKMGIRE